MIFYLAYAVSVFVSLFFLVCLFLCYDMGVSPAINTNNNNNNNNQGVEPFQITVRVQV